MFATRCLHANTCSSKKTVASTQEGSTLAASLLTRCQKNLLGDRDRGSSEQKSRKWKEGDSSSRLLLLRQTDRRMGYLVVVYAVGKDEKMAIRHCLGERVLLQV